MSGSSRSPDRFATTFDHEWTGGQRGPDPGGNADGPSGPFGADRAVGAHRFREPGPQDLHRGRRDARRGHSYRSRRDAARRTHRAGAGIPPDGALDGRDVAADVHVRSHPPARSGAVAPPWRAPGDWAPAPARRRWWSIRAPRSARSTANKNKAPRTACPQRARLSPRCSPHAPTPARCSAPACAKAPRGPREAWSASSTSSPRTCDAPALPGRPRCAADLRILVTQTDRPSRRPRLQVVDHRHPRIRCSRSDPSNPQHRMDRHRHQRRPRPGRRDPYTTGRGKAKRTVRLVVRRHPPREGAQQRLWPDWRHHAFNANTETDTAAADEFHRAHAVVELAIRDLKEGTGLEHVPSGHYGANCAWLACAVLAHNIGHWTTALAGASPATNRSRRTRLVALAAVLVNRSGTPTLRYPARWPWETQFRATLSALRALPGPSG